MIACPPGGPEVAHQIINTGTTTMRYLALSTIAEVETCEYPDSQKVLVVAGPRGQRRVGELHQQVRDAVKCHFEADNVPKLIRLHFVRDEVITTAA